MQRQGIWNKRIVAVAGLFCGLSIVVIGVQQKQARRTTDPPIAGRGKLGQDLFLAIDHRNTSEIKALLSKGADPNSRNGLEFTPLYIASASFQMDVMVELLNAGAEPDAESNYGTPLMFAAGSGNLAGAKILLAKGVDINAGRNDGMTVLMAASYSGNPDFVSELVNRKAAPLDEPVERTEPNDTAP